MISGIVAASLAVALFAARLVAPGPADFYIEPMTGMVLLAVTPGSFVMGSPEREAGRNDDEVAHRVTLSRLFYIGKHEVTQAEWTKVMGSNPSHFANCERCPVERVNFYDVYAFLSRLNAGTTAMEFRLPTDEIEPLNDDFPERFRFDGNVGRPQQFHRAETIGQHIPLELRGRHPRGRPLGERGPGVRRGGGDA